MPPLREPAGFAPDLSAGSPNRVVGCAITPVRGLTPGLLVALGRLGVDFFQLRDRQASDREFERLLVRIESEAPEMLRRVVVNDRLALAASFPVAGVHLPEAGLPLPAVRSRFPRGGLLLGRSVHGVEAALTADRAGADYLILGPVAATGAKRPLPSGVLEEVCRRVEAPVWAVGGLTPRSLPRLSGTGVSGVAAIRSFGDLPAAAAFLAARDAAWRPRAAGPSRMPGTLGAPV